ncbi:MAG: hypothetical protein HY974_01310 [Candidatus Kerfeldbacteria bacterium]|nr:hypothetical protein [Candidatus Kerfeldbacteria bacterium]
MLKSPEVPPVDVGGGLGEEVAHEEANMMRGYMHKEGLPDLFNESQVEHSASPEDYDAALAAIEKVKQLAESEPATTKVLYTLGRALHNVARVPGGAIAFIDQMLWVLAKDIDIATRGATEGGRREIEWEDYRALHQGGPSGLVTPDLAKLDHLVKARLVDATKELRQMKKLGQRYAKAERKDVKV